MIPHSDISAIRLKGELGYHSIFNLYNNCNNNSTTNTLHAYLDNNIDSVLPSPTDCMFWFGDFNRHHLLWEEDKNQRLYSPPYLIDPLIDMIQVLNMDLALPPGIPTYESAAGNWTRPNNIWRSNNPANLIISCDTKPSLRPQKVDHLPIVTILDLSVSHTTPFPSCNMRQVDYTSFNDKLCAQLEAHCPASCLRRKEDLDIAADSLVNTINEIMEESLLISRPFPYAKC